MEYNSIDLIFAAHLELIGTDVEAWSDLLAEDAVVEFPYATALGAPSRFEGKPAICVVVALGQLSVPAGAE